MLPALFAFPSEAARREGWGRLLELSAGSAELSTVTPLSPGESLFLFFDLAGERFDAVPARVVQAEQDADGYCAARLELRGQAVRRRLARVLLGVISSRV